MFIVNVPAIRHQSFGLYEYFFVVNFTHRKAQNTNWHTKQYTNHEQRVRQRGSSHRALIQTIIQIDAMKWSKKMSKTLVSILFKSSGLFRSNDVYKIN